MSTWFLYLTDIIWHFGPKCLPDFYIWQILFDISVPNVYLISISDRYNSILDSKWLPDIYIWQILFYLGLKMATWYLYLTDIIPLSAQNVYLISISDRYFSIIGPKCLSDFYIWQILFHYRPKMSIWFLYLTDIIPLSAQNVYLISISDRYYSIMGPKWLSDFYIWILFNFGPKMAIWLLYLTNVLLFWAQKLGWAPTHQNWCRVLSVFKVRNFLMSVFVGFCRIFVGYLQQYLKLIILKIYENSLQKRLCSIHNLDRSVLSQSFSSLRQNAASVYYIREGYFLLKYYIIINLELRYS